MNITTLSSLQLNQIMAETKTEPVFITNDGKIAHVLMSIELYEYLTQHQQKVADLLAMPEGGEDIDFEIPTLTDLAQAADLS